MDELIFDLTPGAAFASRFRVVRQIARGGMGAVYEVECSRLSGRHALKILHREIGGEKYRARFHDEARLGAQIESDHVVRMRDWGVDEHTRTPWVLMELLEGVDLAEHLDRVGRLSPGEAWDILHQIGHGVGAAHRRQIVHCDLKPANIFLARAVADASPRVKVLDFGISKVIQDHRTSVISTSAAGSPRWMAPEQTERGARIKPATDVWALGILAFQMLTGKSYWRSANAERPKVIAVLAELCADPIVSPSVRARELGVPVLFPAGFDHWFVRCVNRDVDARFSDAMAALAAFPRDIEDEEFTVELSADDLSEVEGTRPSLAEPVSETVEVPEPQAVLNTLRIALSRAEESGDLNRAIELGERILTLDAGDLLTALRTARSSLARARERERRGDRSLALADIERALELDDGDADAWLMRSVLRDLEGDSEGALADINRALGCEPDSVPCHRERARLLHELGRYVEAALAWSELITREPREASYRVARGVAFAAARDWARAANDYSHAIALAPDRPDFYWYRGTALAEGGALAQALEDLERAIRLAPAQGPYWYERCRVLRRAQRIPEARRDLARAAELGFAPAMQELHVLQERGT